MLFNTYLFIFIFLPLAFFGYFIIGHFRLRQVANLWLLAASFIFYSWWNAAFLPLLVISIIANYCIARVIAPFAKLSPKNKKKVLYIGIVLNIGLLAYFKYQGFFIEGLELLGARSVCAPHFIIPIAISFYTIQQIAYLIDCYEGIAEEKNIINYALFVSFFPTIISGPIVHYQESIAQNKNEELLKINFNNIALGLFVFAVGSFKKVVVADMLASWADAGFACQGMLSFIEAWIISLSYTLQIYFDFSGYTDMAIGLALLFNITLPINFNSPLRSSGMIEFWQRWHITLSNFISTYIYTPMVRSLKKITFFKAMVITLITMLIAGLWHGPSWMFIIFGLMHGVGIVINHYWRKRKIRLPWFTSWLMTFCYVNMTFVFFRAENWQRATDILKGIVGLNGLILPNKLSPFLSFLAPYGISFGSFSNINIPWHAPLEIIILVLVILFAKNSSKLLESFSPGWKSLFFASTLFFMALLGMNRISEFIYFKF